MTWYIISIVVAVVVGFVAGTWWAKRHDPAESRAKVLALFTGGREVTNDMVQRALGVSDATATRYLDALEKSGDIVQIGTTGQGVVYKKK